MSKIAYLNSKFVKFRDATVHIEDRGLQFSDSVYEVVAVFNNKLIDFDFHLIRLSFSLNELKINYKINAKKLKNIFEQIISRNKIKSGIIYLQITRGVQSRDHAYKEKNKPNVIIYSLNKKFNLPGKSFIGKTAITTQDLRWKRRDIKTVSLLANVLAKQIAKKNNAYEAILIDNGKVTEGTSSNVWMVKNNILMTHPSNHNILRGITRDSLKKLIEDEKLKFKEKVFDKKQLYKADEVFVTSSTSFVTPIIKIDNIKINKGKIGPVSLKLSDIYYRKVCCE